MDQQRKPKGHVQIQAPPAKVVAAVKADNHMEEKVEEMKKHDGHTDYCGGL